MPRANAQWENRKPKQQSRRTKTKNVMKKVFVAVALATAVVASASAQNKYKPEGMSFSAEINYSFGSGSIGGNTGDGAWSNGGFELPKYGAKFRLFIDNNWAVRLNLGLGTGTDKTTNYFTNPNDPDDKKEYETVRKNTTTTFSLMPGFEYHFNKFERISPYVGAEIGILTNTTKENEENELDETTYTKKTPGIGFAFNVITGFDVYLCKGLYMGCELGLGYDSMKTKRFTETTEAAGETHETEGPDSSLKSFFGFHAQPSLRIGWHF